MAVAVRGRIKIPASETPWNSAPDRVGNHSVSKVQLSSGRKRHLLVDTLGLLVAVLVTSADVQDAEGGQRLADQVGDTQPRLALIRGDTKYGGVFRQHVAATRGWRVETVARPAGAEGFVPLPHRWIVERTFAWLYRCRRLSKDYEALPAVAETLIKVALIHLMLNRLCPKANQPQFRYRKAA